jgi:hypothetical protein
VIRFGNQEPAIKTPKQFAIQSSPTADGKLAVRVLADQVQFSAPLAPAYVLWEPDAQFVQQPARRLWTKKYIGTDAAFYKAGYRWGVSIGNSPESFRQSPLYRTGGGINLPDGKYVFGIRANAKGATEVVIGKEDRGIDKRLLTAFAAGELPESQYGKELLGVANHSMLISRGKPFDAKHPDGFSTIFCGELGVEDFRITSINDQSGQFFGPNGLTEPLSPGQEPAPEQKLMKQPDYEDVKSHALVAARQVIESITGHTGIHLVKVVFEPAAPPQDELRQPRETLVKASQGVELMAALKEPAVQQVLDMLDVDPEAQVRFVKGLAAHGRYRQPVLALTQQLIALETLKPEQAAKLAVELLTEPEGLGLFVPGHPIYLSELSDNTKRKLLAAYNKLDLSKDQPLKKLIPAIRNHHPVVLHFLVGRRIAGGFLKQALSGLKEASDSIKATLALFKWGDPGHRVERRQSPPALAEDHTVCLLRVSRSDWQIRQVEKAIRKYPDRPMSLVLLTNPFNGQEDGKQLADNIQRLKQLEKQGVTVFRSPEAQDGEGLAFMTHLFAYVHAPTSAEAMYRRERMFGLLSRYGVDTEAMGTFVREKFRDRWPNDLIVAAYGQHHAGFRHLLKDMAWFRDLPALSATTLPGSSH